MRFGAADARRINGLQVCGNFSLKKCGSPSVTWSKLTSAASARSTTFHINLGLRRICRTCADLGRRRPPLASNVLEVAHNLAEPILDEKEVWLDDLHLRGCGLREPLREHPELSNRHSEVGTHSSHDIATHVGVAPFYSSQVVGTVSEFRC